VPRQAQTNLTTILKSIRQSRLQLTWRTSASYLSCSLRQRPARQLRGKRFPSLQRVLAHAQEASRTGNYREAARDYTEIVRAVPQMPQVWANLGLMQYLLGEYAPAEQSLRRALRQNPDLFPPNLFLGLDLLNEDKPHQALAYLLKARQVNAQDVQTTLALGRAWIALGRFNRAIDCYTKALQIAPGNSTALYELGSAYIAEQARAAQTLGDMPHGSIYQSLLLAESLRGQGRPTESVYILQHSGLGSSRPAGLYTALGLAYGDLGNYPRAKAAFRQELKYHPGYLPARMGLARTDIESGDTENSVRELEICWRTDARFARTHLPELWQGQNSQQEGALRVRLNQALTQKPVPALARALAANLGAGRVYEPRDFSEALPHASRAEPMSREYSARAMAPAAGLFRHGFYSRCETMLLPNSAYLDKTSLLLLAKCAYFTGDYRYSYLASRRGMATNPKDPSSFYWGAQSAEKMAMEAFTSEQTVHPNSYEVHVILGQAYRTMHRFKASISQYKEALELNPSSLGARLGLATTYWDQLNFGEAVPLLRQVLVARPHEPQANYLLGEILVTEHQFAPAVPHLLIALRGLTGFTALYAHAELGKVYAAESRWNAAADELQQSLPADDDGSLHFQLYQTYRKMGDKARAAEALEKSREISEVARTKVKEFDQEAVVERESMSSP
jgi:tetratricopeptide (TPR) repeat protein